MKLKIFLIISIVAIFLSLFLNNIYLLSSQKGPLIKMKNGDTLTIGLNETAIIKNIWKDESFKDWNIRIKVLSIDREAIKTQISSSTFLGEDFNETKFIKTDESISVIQAEEVTTKIRLDKIIADSAIFSLKIQTAPPAPELSENFDVEIE